MAQFSPGPQPTYTDSQGDDPNWVTPPPVGFVTAGNEVSEFHEPIVWEGDQA